MKCDLNCPVFPHTILQLTNDSQVTSYFQTMFFLTQLRSSTSDSFSVVTDQQT